MINCGSYPGLLDATDGQGRAIAGELWQVDDDGVKRLDIVEGTVDHLFERRAVRLQGVREPVEAYYFAAEAAGMADAGTNWQASSQC